MGLSQWGYICISPLAYGDELITFFQKWPLFWHTFWWISWFFDEFHEKHGNSEIEPEYSYPENTENTEKPIKTVKTPTRQNPFKTRVNKHGFMSNTGINTDLCLTRV